MDHNPTILDVFHFIVDFDMGELVQNFIAQIVGWAQDFFDALFGGLI